MPRSGAAIVTRQHARIEHADFARTHGCQANEYDSARMVDVLRDCGGYELTDDPASADLILLNTCSIREKAQEKVFSQLGTWKHLKQARPHLE